MLNSAQKESATAGTSGAQQGTYQHHDCIAFSRGYGKHDNTPAQRSAPDFDGFLDAIKRDVATGSNQQWIAGPAGIAPDDEAHRREPGKKQVAGKPHRCASCVQPRRFIGLDIDDGLTPESFIDLVTHCQRYHGLIYTTASHTPDKPRCRVILALDDAAPRSDFIAATKAVQARIQRDVPVVFDPAADKPEQPLFLPSNRSDMYRLDGCALCLAELLADAPVGQSAEAIPVNGAEIQSNAFLVKALMTGDNLHDSTTKLAFRHVEDGMQPPKIVESLRGLMNAMPEKGDLQRWQDRYADIPRLVTDARRKLGNEDTSADTASTACLHLMECGDLSQAARSPIECVMYPYLPKRQVTLLGGHGGAGKTYLALVFAAHLAAGATWSGHECQAGRVLFVSLEDEPDLIRWRLACVCEAYALDMKAVSAGIAIMDGTTTAATLAIETGNGKRLEETRAWQDMAAYASGFDTVMVDNASDAFTANVNDPALVRVFLRRLKTVARHANAACLLLAHIDKAGARTGANGNSYIGTAAWHNTVRSRIALVDDDGALSLVHEKHNLTTEAGTIHIQKAEHGVPMPVNQQDIQHDARVFDAMQAQKDAPEVLALLTKAVNGGEDIAPTRKGAYTAWHVLQNFGLTGYGGRIGKARFWRAFDVLMESGSIGAEEYVNADYKQRQRIVLLAEKAA